jgi:hypothetical protein
VYHAVVDEIEDTLRQLQGTDRHEDAWLALQRFLHEALDAARSGIDHADKERLVGETRVRLRQKLRLLLDG